MIEILAQGVRETAVTGATGVTIGGLGLWLVQQLIRRGFRLSTQVGNGDGSDKDRTTPGLCAAHADFAAKLDERHDAVMLAIGEVKQAIVRLHDRIDLVLDCRVQDRHRRHKHDESGSNTP